MYWRPQRMSARVLLLIAAVVAGSLAAVEVVRVRERQPMYKEKLAAAMLARRAFNVIREERFKRRIPIDPEVDPQRSGLIGELISPVTTNTGHLAAKQTSINPNFAAIVVDMLRRAGVKAGDTVAVGLSGSFPALNIAVLAAVKTSRMRAVIVASVGSSQWGANHPEFMWPDMEGALIKWGLFQQGSAALSLGGIDDRALGMSKKGRKLLEEAIRRSGVPAFDVKDFGDSLDKRMALYQEKAGEAEIRAYVNVGGGTTSVGTRIGKDLFEAGLNKRMPRGASQIDSVMTRFMARGVPVIHISKISRLAQRYGLPEQPKTMPRAGEGDIFVRQTYSLWLAAGALALAVIMLFAFLRLDLGHRLFTSGRRGDGSATSPEPMV
jgi:poly-gamma-glutamate system protein